jgi:hypothetical protein
MEVANLESAAGGQTASAASKGADLILSFSRQHQPEEELVPF